MKDIAHMLELMDRPAFCAEDGRIIAANKAALARQIPVGDPVEELLLSGREEYHDLGQGCLCLMLECCGERFDATVTAMENRHIFTLEPDDTDDEMRMLALAAQTLREPLGDVMALMEELPAGTDPDRLARIERGLYQMLRIIGNMTSHPVPRMEMQDVNEVLHEIWEKARIACESRGIAFVFQGTRQPVYSCVDAQLLTRAIHNLLSNSLKFAFDGGKVQLELHTLRRSFRIIWRDFGDTRWPIPSPFTRYRREPGIGDGRAGFGLGLRLVHQAATVHGGTVMLHAPEGGGLQVTLTLPIQQDTALRSPRLRVSYSGERDPMLVELSDVLPPEFYKI